MNATFVITEINSKKTGFLLEDNSLVRACSLYNESLLGNVYSAKVVNYVPSINAAFLDAGTGDYLYYSLNDNTNHIFLKHGNTEKVCVGDELLVQIEKEPMKTKKGVATSDIELSGKYFILNRRNEVGISHKILDAELRKRLKSMTEKALEEYNVRFYEEGKNLSLGAIIRTSAEFVSEDELKLELNDLVHTMNGIVDYGMHSVVKKLIYSPDRSIKNELIDIKNKQKYDSFNIITDLKEEYNLLSVDFGSDIKLYNDKMVALHKVFNLEDKLKKAFDRFIYLKSGGSIIVEPTEALTVIDVNTGKAIKGKNTEKSFLKINKEAAEAIAKVIRLRNISGIIIIDFINMKEIESIKELLDYLKKQLDKDEVKVTFVDMTPLGLVELTRKKEAKPLTLQDFL